MGIFNSILNNAKSGTGKIIGSAVNKAVSNAKNDVKDKISSAAVKAVTHKTKTFTYDSIPTCLDQLKALKEADMKDPFGVAALTVLAFNTFASDREAGIEMLDYLNGPADVTPRDKQFINDRFMDGKDYVPRSYFRGATPANNYTPDTPYTIDVEEQTRSRDSFNEGYIRLYLHSGGADSDRPVVLRTKPSTGEWFLWDYAGILLDIRLPAEKDLWA